MSDVVPTTETPSLSNTEARRSDKGKREKRKKAEEKRISIVNLDRPGARLRGQRRRVIERHSECINTAEQGDQAGVLIAHQR